MTATDAARHVESVFRTAGTPLPQLWQWAVLTVASRNFQPDRLHSPWSTELATLKQLYTNESLAFIVPDTWSDPAYDNIIFRRSMAAAIDRDPVTWDELPKRGKRRAISVLDSDEEEDVKVYIKPEEDNRLSRCIYCFASFPPDRMTVHRKQCEAYQTSGFTSDADELPDINPSKPKPKKVKAKSQPQTAIEPGKHRLRSLYMINLHYANAVL